MMDCKKALKETDGDMTKATEWLRQKGITSDKKAGRGGRRTVGSYIHTGGRVGVLVEVNCDRLCGSSWEFQTLVRNIAMQIAACPNVEDRRHSKPNRPEGKEIEMGRDDLAKSQITSKKRLFRVRLKSA